MKAISYLLIIIHIILCSGFVYRPLNPPLIHKELTKTGLHIKECGERLIYKNYLMGLRKTRKYLNTSATADTLVSIFNITNNFLPFSSNNTLNINNTDTIVKNIVVGNIILNVSNVKYVHISTSQDKLIIELDKASQNDINILEQINNLDSILSTISILGKIMNMN